MAKKRLSRNYITLSKKSILAFSRRKNKFLQMNSKADS